MPAPDAPPATFRPLMSKALKASAEEAAQNPRARSAKLRAGERLNATAFAGDEDLGLPRHADLPDLEGMLA